MADELVEESEQIVSFRTWLTSNGGTIHPNVHFQKVGSGFSIIAKESIEGDATIVSCPFQLVVTPELATQALAAILNGIDPTPFRKWSERQLICAYICMHYILIDERNLSILKHRPYISILPATSQLRTSLHFTPSELDLFKGSNLYGATVDRHRAWQQEHKECQAFIASRNLTWGAELTWENYLTAATYISSRAFPSTLLDTTPSLVSTPGSYPILLPGVDALNHARAQPVSWVVSHPTSITSPSIQSSAISLVLHTPTPLGHELFNNYGPKPNAELILGYGFSLLNNPDDTIVLKIGGNFNVSGATWEVGRSAKGIEPVWEAILAAVHQPEDEDVNEEDEGEQEVINVEDELYAAEMLAGMAGGLLDRLPSADACGTSEEIRPEVATMLVHYIEGQRDILQSIILFAQEKEQRALRLAEEQGLDIVEEEEEGDE